MKRVLLAAMLLTAAAGARAESDAYSSLVGMASAAAGDKGPDAGELPKDDAALRPDTLAMREPETSTDSDAAGLDEAPKPAARPPAPRSEAPKNKEKEGDAVVAPAPSAPRLWTRVFSTLTPSDRAVPAFEVASSTAAAAPAAPKKKRSCPARQGAAQGLAELVAAVTAEPLAR